MKRLITLKYIGYPGCIPNHFDHIMVTQTKATESCLFPVDVFLQKSYCCVIFTTCTKQQVTFAPPFWTQHISTPSSLSMPLMAAGQLAPQHCTLHQKQLGLNVSGLTHSKHRSSVLMRRSTSFVKQRKPKSAQHATMQNNTKHGSICKSKPAVSNPLGTVRKYCEMSSARARARGDCPNGPKRGSKPWSLKHQRLQLVSLLNLEDLFVGCSI